MVKIRKRRKTVLPLLGGPWISVVEKRESRSRSGKNVSSEGMYVGPRGCQVGKGTKNKDQIRIE